MHTSIYAPTFIYFFASPFQTENELDYMNPCAQIITQIIYLW